MGVKTRTTAGVDKYTGNDTLPVGRLEKVLYTATIFQRNKAVRPQLPSLLRSVPLPVKIVLVLPTCPVLSLLVRPPLLTVSTRT